MNFDLDDEQEELRSSVRAVLEQESPVTLARGMYEGGATPEQPWKSARELGWTALVVPEEFGGLGLGAIELGLLCEEHGRVLATGPFLSTASQWIPAIDQAGSDEQKRRFLPSAAEGNCIGTLAIAGEAGSFRGDDSGLSAQPDGDSWILDGSRSYVLDANLEGGRVADEIVAVAKVEQGDGVGIFSLPGDAVKAVRNRNLDSSRPLARLEFGSVRVESDRVLGTPGESARALDRIVSTATVALCFEMIGTCQALFDISLEYAKHREQFGKPIGSFQATQHKFANLFIALEKARSIALYAAMTLAERSPSPSKKSPSPSSKGPSPSNKSLSSSEEGPSISLAASMAKAAVGECQSLLCKEGIQIHGGLGYTWEQDVHLYVKRLKTGEALLGTTGDHRQRIADAIGV